MALPEQMARGLARVDVGFDKDGNLTPWCGAKNFSISVSNEIKETKVGDCEDWSKPIQTVKSFGSQSVTATMDATMTREMHTKTAHWSLGQARLWVEILFPDARAGEVQKYRGKAVLSDFQIGGIGNVEGDLLSETLSLDFDGSVVAYIGGAEVIAADYVATNFNHIS